MKVGSVVLLKMNPSIKDVLPRTDLFKGDFWGSVLFCIFAISVVLFPFSFVVKEELVQWTRLLLVLWILVFHLIILDLYRGGIMMRFFSLITMFAATLLIMLDVAANSSEYIFIVTIFFVAIVLSVIGLFWRKESTGVSLKIAEDM